MLPQICHMLLQMSDILPQMCHMLLQMGDMLPQRCPMLLQMCDRLTHCNDLFSRFEQQILFLEKQAEATNPTTDRHGHEDRRRVSF